MTLATDKKQLYAVTFFILAALILAIPFQEKYSRFVAAAIFLIAVLTIGFFIKKRSILSYHKRNVLLIMTVIAALYLMLYYLSGLYFGFGATYMKFSIAQLVLYIFPIVVIVLTSEYVRTVLHGQGSKLVSALTYVICVISDVFIAGGVNGINSSYKFVDFVGMTLFPAITGNILYHYISKRYGTLPNVSYRLILTLYTYVIPFAPDAPQVLPAFARLVSPIIVYLFIDLLFEKKRRMATHKKSKFGFIIPCIAAIIMVAFVMLVSCRFRFGILVIASPSMEDEINVGDAVVFESYEHCGEIEENDVIVFSKDGNRKYVHRVIEISTVNGQRQYITKGDANEDADPGYVTEGQIIGVVRSKVLYIGYPSIWLRKIFK